MLLLHLLIAFTLALGASDARSEEPKDEKKLQDPTLAGKKPASVDPLVLDALRTLVEPASSSAELSRALWRISELDPPETIAPELLKAIVDLTLEPSHQIQSTPPPSASISVSRTAQVVLDLISSQAVVNTLIDRFQKAPSLDAAVTVVQTLGIVREGFFASDRDQNLFNWKQVDHQWVHIQDAKEFLGNWHRARNKKIDWLPSEIVLQAMRPQTPGKLQEEIDRTLSFYDLYRDSESQNFRVAQRALKQVRDFLSGYPTTSKTSRPAALQSLKSFLENYRKQGIDISGLFEDFLTLQRNEFSGKMNPALLQIFAELGVGHSETLARQLSISPPGSKEYLDWLGVTLRVSALDESAQDLAVTHLQKLATLDPLPTAADLEVFSKSLEQISKIEGPRWGDVVDTILDLEKGLSVRAGEKALHPVLKSIFLADQKKLSLLSQLEKRAATEATRVLALPQIESYVFQSEVLRDRVYSLLDNGQFEVTNRSNNILALRWMGKLMSEVGNKSHSDEAYLRMKHCLTNLRDLSMASLYDRRLAEPLLQMLLEKAKKSNDVQTETYIADILKQTPR